MQLRQPNWSNSNDRSMCDSGPNQPIQQSSLLTISAFLSCPIGLAENVELTPETVVQFCSVERVKFTMPMELPVARNAV